MARAGVSERCRRLGLIATKGRAYPRRGEVWTVALPNQPTDPHSPRPAVVISTDVRNRLAGDVLVVPLSSTLRQLPTHVFLPAGIGGQLSDSMANCEHITALDKRFLARGPLGDPIPENLVHEIVLAVRRAVGEIIPWP